VTSRTLAFSRAVPATLRREWLSHRINRFFYWHLALLVAAGTLAVFVAPAQAESGVAWFILNAVLYAVSLSSLLFGLSSSQAESEELPFLATQPTGLGPWVIGKALGLASMVAPASLLLVVPGWITNGWSPLLGQLASASAGICIVLALLGLAIGLWIREPVRALIVAIGVWFALLFATDLLLLLAAGSPWIRDHAALWVVPLMANPLDALRIMVMLTLERAAFSSLGSTPLVQWWIANAGTWLAACLLLWSLAAVAAAIAGATRIRK